jgi:hypothetical protein
MRRCTTVVPVLLASLYVLACGGVDTPDGEPAALPAGAGGSEAAPASGSNPTGTAAPNVGAEGGTVSSSTPPPMDVADRGAGGNDSLPPPVFCDAPTKVLVASCGNGSCHSNSGATIGDFAVDAERAYNFVDKVSVRHASCGRIIDSQDYSKSLLLTKVRGTFPSPECGGRMPVGSFQISEEQIDCLASWLQQFQTSR